MKIAITAQGKDLNTKVDPRFGRCAYFIIYNLDTGDFEALENSNIQTGGGAGIQTAQMISEKNIQAVITGNVGPNAFEVLSTANVKVFAGVAGKVADAIEQYKLGNLNAYSNPSVGSHFGTKNTPEKTPASSGKKRIAIAAEDGQGLEANVSAHFGRCPYYTMIEVESGTVVLSYKVENPFYDTHGQPGQVPDFIRDQGAHVIIAGGMGQRAVEFFSEFSIEVVTGAQGQIKNVIEAYLEGTLKGAAGCKQDSCH